MLMQIHQNKKMTRHDKPYVGFRDSIQPADIQQKRQQKEWKITGNAEAASEIANPGFELNVIQFLRFSMVKVFFFPS